MIYVARNVETWPKRRSRVPRPPLPSLAEIMQAVFKSRGKEIGDSIARNNALLAALRAKP